MTIGQFACWWGFHRWMFHRHVRDWFCHRCRKRKRSLGVKR